MVELIDKVAIVDGTHPISVRVSLEAAKYMCWIVVCVTNNFN